MTLTGSERTLFGKPTEDSLAFSCYTEGDLASLAPVRRIMVVAATQTESAAQADASVNTSIVMEELGFRCIACSKPPKPRFYDSEGIAPVIPGPEAKAGARCSARACRSVSARGVCSGLQRVALPHPASLRLLAMPHRS